MTANGVRVEWQPTVPMLRERVLEMLGDIANRDHDANLAEKCLGAFAVCPSGLVDEWTGGPIALEAAATITKMPILPGSASEIPTALVQAVGVIQDRRAADQLRRMPKGSGAGG